MGTAVTVGILVVVAGIAVYAVRHTVRVATGKDGCCGGGGGSGRTGQACKTPKAAAVDTDPSHYGYTTELTVRGMTCERCAQRVERFLNALPGTWATVDLSSRVATVRTKEPIDVADLESAVERAGYSVIRM